MHHRHELPFGAELRADGVRFRVWASRARSVAVQIGDGAAPIAMTAEPGGIYSVTTDRAGAGSRYKFVVDGEAYPDPASRFQPDGVHGPSEVIDPDSYNWREQGWAGRRWEETVLYELHLGAFSEGGNFAGAVARLDDLCDLGVTAIELMPIAAFPGQRNWGYDGVMLYAPAAGYGRPDDLKALVEACHARGLAIFLDVVYNHFGPEGNYLHPIAPDFFTDRHQTPWGAAIAYDAANARPVRDFAIHNALYWLQEYRFDGLRLDAVHAIIDNSAPDILSELAETVRQRVTDRPVHLVLENDNNEARRLRRRDGRPVHYTAQWNDDLHHALHVLVTGQTSGYYADFAQHPARQLGRSLASGFAFQGDRSPFRDGERRGEDSSDLPATAFVAFLQNHDQIGNTPFGTRITGIAEEEAVHAAVAIVLLSPQVPMLFMGEEWGSSQPFPFFCDFAPPLDEAVREGRKREFAQYPEFADPALRNRIPDGAAESTFASARLDWSERERGEHARWLSRYRHMLALRRKEIVPRLADIVPGGSYREIGERALHAEWRFADGTGLVLLANFAERAVPLPLPVEGMRLLYSTAGVRPSNAVLPLSATFLLR